MRAPVRVSLTAARRPTRRPPRPPPKQGTAARTPPPPQRPKREPHIDAVKLPVLPPRPAPQPASASTASSNSTASSPAEIVDVPVASAPRFRRWHGGSNRQLLGTRQTSLAGYRHYPLCICAIWTDTIHPTPSFTPRLLYHHSCPHLSPILLCEERIRHFIFPFKRRHLFCNPPCQQVLRL